MTAWRRCWWRAGSGIGLSYNDAGKCADDLSDRRHHGQWDDRPPMLWGSGKRRDSNLDIDGLQVSSTILTSGAYGFPSAGTVAMVGQHLGNDTGVRDIKLEPPLILAMARFE